MAKDRIALVDEVRSLLREADEVGAGVECDFAAKQIVVEMSHFAEDSIPGGVVASAIELSQAGWGRGRQPARRP